MKKDKRLELRLNEKHIQAIDELVESMNASGRSEVVRTALEVLCAVKEIAGEDDSIYIVEEDGSCTRIVLFQLKK